MASLFQTASRGQFVLRPPKLPFQSAFYCPPRSAYTTHSDRFLRGMRHTAQDPLHNELGNQRRFVLAFVAKNRVRQNHYARFMLEYAGRKSPDLWRALPAGSLTDEF